MMRAYTTALHQQNTTGKRCPIALWDELEATFGVAKTSTQTLNLKHELITDGFDGSQFSPTKPSISQIFFKTCVTPCKSKVLQEIKEAKRNEKFQRRLKIMEEFEDRREMAREKRFQEILIAIANANKKNKFYK